MNDVLYEAQRDNHSFSGRKGQLRDRGTLRQPDPERPFSQCVYSCTFDLRVRNVQARTGREERSARKMVKRTDKERRAYYEFFTDAKWTDLSQYDLCIDSSRFTQDQILEILTEAAREC